MSATFQSPISSLLSSTPLDSTLQKHLHRVYTTLTTAILLAIAGTLVDLYTTLPLGQVSTYLIIPTLLFFSASQRYSTTRYYLFHFFAFLSGLSSGPLVTLAVAAADPCMPLIAFAGAVVVFMGFSLSALFAKRKSYLFLGGVLWTALWGMLLLSVVGMFARRLVGFGVLLYGGLFLMCAFVLYDTQMIVEKVAAGDVDYVSHAMELLIDFVDIFKRLLIIMLMNDQRKRESDRRKRGE